MYEYSPEYSPMALVLDQVKSQKSSAPFIANKSVFTDFQISKVVNSKNFFKFNTKTILRILTFVKPGGALSLGLWTIQLFSRVSLVLIF